MILDQILLFSESSLRFLDIKVINASDFYNLLLRFCINLAMSHVIIRYIFKSSFRNKDFTFTYYSLSALIFLLCYLLGNVKLELGFALGLFAIFGIIRYRTSLISIKEMTYLFVLIGIAVINALANKKVSWTELAFANLAIIFIMHIREIVVARSKIHEKEIVYDNVALIHPEKKEELFADINARLGVEVVEVKVGRVNYIKDSAQILIYYKHITPSK